MKRRRSNNKNPLLTFAGVKNGHGRREEEVLTFVFAVGHDCLFSPPIYLFIYFTLFIPQTYRRKYNQNTDKAMYYFQCVYSGESGNDQLLWHGCCSKSKEHKQSPLWARKSSLCRFRNSKKTSDFQFREKKSDSNARASSVFFFLTLPRSISIWPSMTWLLFP